MRLRPWDFGGSIELREPSFCSSTSTVGVAVSRAHLEESYRMTTWKDCFLKLLIQKNVSLSCSPPPNSLPRDISSFLHVLPEMFYVYSSKHECIFLCPIFTDESVQHIFLYCKLHNKIHHLTILKCTFSGI